MTSYSFESILFFYAYHPKKRLRDNIDNFINKLINIRLKIKGADLKRIGLKPFALYGKTLTATLHAKIEKNLRTKKQELDEAVRIFKKLASKRG